MKARASPQAHSFNCQAKTHQMKQLEVARLSAAVGDQANAIQSLA